MAYPYSVTYRAATLSEAQYNADQQNHSTNNIPTAINDYSNDVTEMQVTTNPGGLGSESLATDLAGELARIRYMIKALTGTAQWYIDPGISVGASAFAAATRMVFQQTSAPTGWTKVTTNYDDAAFRCVTGTVNDPASTNPSRSGFLTTVMALSTTGGTTLTTAMIPAHTHVTMAPSQTPPLIGSLGTGGGNIYSNQAGVSNANTGGGGSHNHTITMNIKYVDLIVAVKN